MEVGTGHLHFQFRDGDGLSDFTMEESLVSPRHLLL